MDVSASLSSIPPKSQLWKMVLLLKVREQRVVYVCRRQDVEYSVLCCRLMEFCGFTKPIEGVLVFQEPSSRILYSLSVFVYSSSWILVLPVAKCCSSNKTGSS